MGDSDLLSPRRFVLSSPYIPKIFSTAIGELEGSMISRTARWSEDLKTSFLQYSYSGLPWNILGQWYTVFPGLSVALNFRGTEAYIIGTMDVVEEEDGTLVPTWDCILDGEVINDPEFAPRVGAGNNVRLCGVRNLPDTAHKLRIELKYVGQPGVATRDSRFWFDRAEYLPSPSILEKPHYDGMMVVVDNEDPAIQTQGDWKTVPVNATNVLLTGPPDELVYIAGNNSVLQTSQPGSSFFFSFHGSQISLFGYSVYNQVFDQGIPLSYTIDDGPKAYFFTVQLPVPLRGGMARLSEGSPLFNQPLVTTPRLAVGKHNFTLTMERPDKGPPYTAFSLDYLVIHDYQGGLSVPSSPSSDSGSGSGSNPPSSDSNNGTAAGRLSTPGIVGIALGSVALLALLGGMLGFFLWYRRRLQSSSPQDRTSTSRQPSPTEIISPFTPIIEISADDPPVSGRSQTSFSKGLIVANGKNRTTRPAVPVSRELQSESILIPSSPPSSRTGTSVSSTSGPPGRGLLPPLYTET